MRKLIKINEKRIPILAAFFVPLLIVIIVCIDHGVYPFGDRCILHVDMYHQYCPFFTELMDKLKTGGSPFYSWSIGLGSDFVSLYAYYLASPLNLLLLLCPRGAVIEFMTLLVILKIALSGVTFGYYLKQHFRIDHLAISIWGTAYALSGFMAAYAWNIMWLDCVVLAPLIILGLERLIKEGRPMLYYVTLALSIWCNYYISIMICIFLVLWFLFYWCQNRKNGIMSWVRFAVYSLLAGGTGAVLMLPTAIVLGYSSTEGVSFPKSVEWYFGMMQELARHAVLTDSYTGAEHWPNLYCGVFVLVFVVLFFFNRRISWKKKLGYGMLVALFVLSFANNYLDFIWHGLRFPTSLPGRQSFLYVFVLLVISYEAFLHIKSSRLWHVALAAASNVAFWVVAYRVTDEEMISADAFLATAIFAGSYLVLVALYLAGTDKIRQWMLWVGCFAMLAELTLNFDVTGLDTTTRSTYVENLNDYRQVLSVVEEQMEEEGDLFYRTEELERKTKNDAALSGYYSLTQFSSLMNLNVSHFYQDVGMEGGKNFYCANGATPLLASMLSLRYVIADNDMEENPLRRLVTSSGETWLYENTHVLPLGFMMSEEVVEAWNYDNVGDIHAQNELAELLGATEQMLVPTASISVNGESSFTAEADGFYYATYEKTSVDNLTEETSDGRERSFTKVSHGYTLDLGYCEAGTEVKITNDDHERVVMTVYRLNQSAFETAFDTLNAQTMELTAFSDTRIEGKVSVTEAGRMIFSIAKEEGWSLYVDGSKVEPECFGGAFISVHLEEGEHEILLAYETPGIRLGAAISAGCVTIFLLLMLYRKKRGLSL